MIPLSDIRAAAGTDRGARPPHAAPVLAPARRAGRRAAVAQVRELPEDGLVQGARRAQQGAVAVRRPSARAASSRSRPATTRRRWRGRRATAGCAAVVVMPTDAPRSKIDAVRGYGAEIVFHADRPTLFDKLHEVRDAARPDVRPSLRRPGRAGRRRHGGPRDRRGPSGRRGRRSCRSAAADCSAASPPRSSSCCPRRASSPSSSTAGPGLGAGARGRKARPRAAARDARRRHDAALRRRAAARDRARSRGRDRDRDGGGDPRGDAPAR